MTMKGGVSYISIHAPVKGATFLQLRDRRLPADFNPRTREGYDTIESVEANAQTLYGCYTTYKHVILFSHHISIPAPVKGATAVT